MRKTIIILGSALCQLAYATPITNTTNATATLAATCSISAQSISFGALATPLYAQSANSSMNVLCSKEAPYKIDLAFGNVGGYFLFKNATEARGIYTFNFWVYDKNGNNTLTLDSFSSSNGYITASRVESTMGCKMTDPDSSYGSKCYISYNSGKMTGGIKGDSVAYTIFIPNDSSKVWSVGKNSYSGIGTGSNQTIPVRAQIVPAESAAFPAPDFYSDTVVATITY